MRIVFLNYGEFGNNSDGHISGFAQGLIDRGHQVLVVARGDPQSARLPPGVAVSVEQIHASSKLRASLADPATLLHIWTPREAVRRLGMRIGAGRLRYVVHLEDHEEIVTAAHCDRAWADLQAIEDERLDVEIPPHLSHPRRYVEFLRGAVGVTVITDSLRVLAPAGVPVHVLQPGVSLTPLGRLNLPQVAREMFGVPPGALVLLHHGSIHPANQADIFSLYAAVRALRDDGMQVVLVRPGNPPYVTRRCLAFEDAEGVLSPGFISSEVLRGLLEMADICVQPGGATPFNVYRYPSKLPEFLAMGKPTITAAANLGLQLRDGIDAILIRRGDAAELAGAIRRIAGSPRLAQRLGRNARIFAERRLRWDDKVRALERFYSLRTAARDRA